MKQTKLESLLEQLINIGSGFFISFLLWDWVVRPMIIAGWITIDSTLAITAIFTVVSVIRGYIFRRAFNRGIHKYVQRVVAEFFQSDFFKRWD